MQVTDVTSHAKRSKVKNFLSVAVAEELISPFATQTAIFLGANLNILELSNFKRIIPIYLEK